MVKGLSLGEGYSKEVGSRWRRDCVGESKRKREKTVCVSASQHLDISTAALCLSSYLTQVSGEWAAGSVWRDHTKV